MQDLTEEKAFVIEGPGPVYWSGKDFDTDDLNAVRFVRHIDAMRVWANVFGADRMLHVREHIWPKGKQ
jgi:hypothetical protein